MSRYLDPEMMEHIRERMERIRAYVPAEDFDETTALMLAKREIAPLYGAGPDSRGLSSAGGQPGGTYE